MIDLIFPPVASPTCVPLGVSFLKAHIDSVFGPGRLRVQDLNIKYWNYLIEQNDEFCSFQSFTQGDSAPFTREYYEPLLPLQQLMKIEVDKQLRSVRKYVDTGIITDKVLHLFNFLAEFIPLGEEPIMFSCLFPDQLLFTLGFSKWLNQERGARIYLGGASVLVVNPEELMGLAYWVDGVFTGEGELAMEIFIRDGETASVPGLYKRYNGHIIHDSQVIAPPMDNLTPPDFSWATLSSYFNPEPVLPVQFSRSCKWRRCRFCAHNFSFGQYRCMSPKGAADMLENYSLTLGANHFYITDQYLDASFLEPFALEVISRKLTIRYTFMGRPAEDMTGDLMTLLAQSGCRWISWGVESGNARLLDLAQKGTKPEIVSKVLKDSSEAGIRNQALMIFGLPGSDDSAANDTYNFLQENRPWIHSHTSSEFQLYKGTPFGNKPERYGLKVTGTSVFCRINGTPLESVKREHTNVSTAEDAEILRGPLEAKKWKRLGIWIYPDNFWNSLPSEHYLLLSSKEWDLDHPVNPLLEDKIS